MKESLDKKPDLVKVEALKVIFVEHTAEELAKLQANDKDGRSFAGAARRVEIGESVSVTKAVAKKLQASRAVSVAL